MKTISLIFGFCVYFCQLQSAVDPLSAWNEGSTKQSIIDFVRLTTDKSSAQYVPEDERIATFDQDGTLWVEHPLYTQLVYVLDRVPVIVNQKPELKNQEPFKTVLAGDLQAISKLQLSDIETIAKETLAGMTIDQFHNEVEQWLSTAKDKRWNRLYTQLIYKPMKQMIDYLGENGYRTYIVTGGGQDFVRAYAKRTYGIPSEQVIGTAGEVKYSYDKNQNPVLVKEPKVLLNDNFAGKPEGIHLVIGKRPYAAFGNSTGDREMLEYTKAGNGQRLSMLVLHDDSEREYAYGPALGLPDTHVGTFTQGLYDEAKAKGWVVISMKNDWKEVFAD